MTDDRASGLSMRKRARVLREHSDKGLVDMVMLIGLYMTTCSIINAFEVAVPETSQSMNASSA